MARPKKSEEKAKEVETLSIDVDSFVRTRDSVVTGLATLQDAIRTLSSAYIKHTNAVLGDHEELAVDLDEALSKVGSNPLLASLKGLERAASPAKSGAADKAEEKKERKKRTHDPNAPKRPLTPFFLYMQTARPIIAIDLGEGAAKGAVSNEGTRRWAEMAPHDKEQWTAVYKTNLRLYQARVHLYKTGANPNAKDMTDEETIAWADANNFPGPEASPDAQLTSEAALQDVDAEAEDDEEPEKEPTPPPAKATPKPKSSRKSKTKAAEPEVITPSVASSSVIPVPKAAEKEPEKPASAKRKRASKKGVEEPVAEKEELAVETPKSGKNRKKKAKTDN